MPSENLMELQNAVISVTNLVLTQRLAKMLGISLI